MTGIVERVKAAIAAFRQDPEGPRNGGHRFAIQATDGLYCWADAYRLDPISGDPIWICDRGDHVELKRNLPGWGILVDLNPGITVEEFMNEDQSC